MTPEERLARYARLAVEVGINLQPGQLVRVAGHPDHLPLIRAISDVAYERGAKYVEALYADPHIRRSRIIHAPEDTLDWSPPWTLSLVETLAKETHKLESRYLDSLIGPYPERRDLYVERSPVHHLDRLSSPMILFQGTEDKAVPPNQATDMADALRAKGLPVALIMFEGEGHGFRQAANLKRSLEAELSFYAQVFGFDLADPIDPVPIDNLQR